MQRCQDTKEKLVKNHFVYGETVSGDNFCDRARETRELVADIKNGQNVIIFSPRRYGKTSLIKQALRTGFLVR